MKMICNTMLFLLLLQQYSPAASASLSNLAEIGNLTLPQPIEIDVPVNLFLVGLELNSSVLSPWVEALPSTMHQSYAAGQRSIGVAGPAVSYRYRFRAIRVSKLVVSAIERVLATNARLDGSGGGMDASGRPVSALYMPASRMAAVLRDLLAACGPGTVMLEQAYNLFILNPSERRVT